MIEIAVANAVIASLLACLVFVIGRVCDKPALSHALWILVLVKLLVWPIADLPIPKTMQNRVSESTLGWSSKPFASESNENIPDVLAPKPSGESAIRKATRASAGNVPPVTGSQPNLSQRSLSWKSFALGIWLVGIFAFAAQAAAGIFRFRKATRGAIAMDATLEAIAKDVADQYQMSVPKIRLTRETMSPVVWCWLARPTVYVPRPLLAELDDRQIATLLAHEFAHIKRHDYLVRWLELITGILFWWLPTVWLARRSVRVAEEQLCDAMVVQNFPTRTSSYVSTLLQTVEFLIDSRSAEPVLASGMGNFRLLKRRCEMIMGRTFEKLSASNRVVLWTLAVITLPFAINLSTSDEAKAQSGSRGRSTRGRAAEQNSLLLQKASRTDFDDSLLAHNDDRSEERYLDHKNEIKLGDLRMRLGDLLALKGFETVRQEDSFAGTVSRFGTNNALSLSEASTTAAEDPTSTQHGSWRYTGKSKAFSKITYEEHPQFASHYRFEVHRKYDQDAARVQLERQLERAFGDKRGTRKIQIDGKEMTFSYHVRQERSNSPHLIISLREIPDWAPESDSEKRKRQKAETESSGGLFG